MNKILFIIASAFLVFPFVVGAHSSGTTDAENSPFMMMQQIEDSVVGDELHEEMENLMIKLMSGQSLTQEEITQITSFMGEYPGPHGMMMNRLGYEGYNLGIHPNYNSGHMGVGMFGFGLGFIWVTQLLFWGVLILAIVALIKWIGKK
jgi:hypothetical protein